jgi:hypothetical protein
LGRYRYCLSHRTGQVGINRKRSKIPPIRVQARAEAIHGLGALETFGWFAEVGEYLAGGPVDWGLSRLDLFADVQGWVPTVEDRSRFVTWATSRVLNEEHDAMTGLAFGRRKTGTISARIYDKTVQVDKKGLDWWPTMWGDGYDRTRPVWRVEFELNRAGLKKYGVRTPLDGLERQGELWAALTEGWLRLAAPTADDTRSRWPTAPEWVAVQHASLRGAAIGAERIRRDATVGELRTVLPAAIGYLARIGSLVGTRGVEDTMSAVRRLVLLDEDPDGGRGVEFADRVASKRTERRYR